MKKIQKTNAMRFLDQHKVEYKAHTYKHNDGDPVDGVHVAQMMNQPVEKVYKTLVTVSNTKEYLVYMIPVEKELDLKKCAKVAGVKSCEMIHVKDINKITGYIRGGCSPLGMKKQFPTVLHASALEQETIVVSGGRIGVQVELQPQVLCTLLRAAAADVVAEA